MSWDISCMLCGLLWPWMICYFASIVGERMASIGDMAYESVWYDYSVQLRKNIILIVTRSRKVAHFTGLGLVICTVEVFGKVNRFNYNLNRNISHIFLIDFRFYDLLARTTCSLEHLLNANLLVLFKTYSLNSSI